MKGILPFKQNKNLNSKEIQSDDLEFIAGGSFGPSNRFSGVPVHLIPGSNINQRIKLINETPSNTPSWRRNFIGPISS